MPLNQTAIIFCQWVCNLWKCIRNPLLPAKQTGMGIEGFWEVEEGFLLETCRTDRSSENSREMQDTGIFHIFGPENGSWQPAKEK